MPFFDEDQILTGVISNTPNQDGSINIQQSEDKKSGFLESARAWYKIEDPIFKISSQFLQPEASDVLDPNFKPIDQLESTRPDLLEYADRFIEVKNNEDYNRTVFNIDYELEQKEILKNATTPVHIAAAMSAGIIDPINLIPFAKVAKTASLAARTTEGVLKGLALGAATGLTREAILQSTSETRSVEQTATNLIAESVAGSIFGGVLGALSKPAIAANKKLLASAIEGEDIKFVVDDFSQDMVGKVAYQQAIEEASKGVPHTDLLSPKAVVSLPGDAVVRMALDVNASKLAEEVGVPVAERVLRRSIGAEEKQLDIGLAHINETIVKLASGPEFLRAPELRAALSKSQTVQKLGDVLYDAPLIKKQHAEGVAIGDKVSNIIDRDRRDMVAFNQQLDSLYLDYTRKGKIASSIEALRGSEKISYRDISRKVWQNMTDSKRVDTIPQVNSMSSLMRSAMDKRTKQLIDAKILDVDLDPELMKNYMTRVYDLDKLSDPIMRGRLEQKITRWAMDHNKDGSVRARSISEDEASFIAEDAVSNIVRESDHAIAMSSITENFISKGRFLKERQLLIPDSEIQEFLVDDGIKLFNNYMDKTSRLLAVQSGLKKIDSSFESIADIEKAIYRDKDEAISKLTDSKEIAQTTRYFKKQAKLANAMYRSALGQIRKPGSNDRWISYALDYNYTNLLGGMTISSLAEVVMPWLRLGLKDTIVHGWTPMLRSIKTSNLVKDQLADLTGALELKQNTMLRLLDGTQDPDLVLREASRIDMTAKAATEILTKASFISNWTSFGTGIAAQISSAKLIRSFKAGITNPKEIERLASIGIDKQMYGRITNQINKHTQKLKGSFVVNPHLWTDQEALNIFKSAVQIDVNATILRSSIGTQPLWVQENAIGKILFQFNSFMNAATSRILIPAIQRRDADVLTGTIGLVCVGGLIQMLKDIIGRRDVEYTPEKFLLNGISNSGLMGLWLTKGIDVYRTLNDPTTARHLDSTVEGMILGPSVGQIGKAVRSLQRVTSEDHEIDNKDRKAAIRLLPYSNLFYITTIMNRVWPNEE